MFPILRGAVICPPSLGFPWTPDLRLPSHSHAVLPFLVTGHTVDLWIGGRLEHKSKSKPPTQTGFVDLLEEMKAKGRGDGGVGERPNSLTIKHFKC